MQNAVQGNELFCQAKAIFWTPGYQDDLYLVMESCACDLWRATFHSPPAPSIFQIRQMTMYASSWEQEISRSLMSPTFSLYVCRVAAFSEACAFCMRT